MFGDYQMVGYQLEETFYEGEGKHEKVPPRRRCWVKNELI